MTEREIVDWLADHPAPAATSNRLSRMLAKRIQSWSGEEAAILAAFERGLSTEESQAVQDRLWTSIMSGSLAPPAEGRQRLLVGLVGQPDAPLDWYRAEYLIQWCTDAGVPIDDVVEDFRTCLAP